MKHADLPNDGNKAAEGRKAYQRGLPREQNPYPQSSAKYWQWSSGWLDERAFRALQESDPAAKDEA